MSRLNKASRGGPHSSILIGQVYLYICEGEEKVCVTLSRKFPKKLEHFRHFKSQNQVGDFFVSYLIKWYSWEAANLFAFQSLSILLTSIINWFTNTNILFRRLVWSNRSLFHVYTTDSDAPSPIKPTPYHTLDNSAYESIVQMYEAWKKLLVVLSYDLTSSTQPLRSPQLSTRTLKAKI